MHLVVECKQLPGNAWIFFPEKEQLGVVPSVSITQLAKMGRMRGFFTSLDLSNEEASRHFHEVVLDANRSNRKTDNIFQALVADAKATDYLRTKAEEDLRGFVEDEFDEITSSDQHNMKFERAIAASIDVYQPTMVLDGTLCIAKRSRKEVLKEVDEVKLVTEYRSSKMVLD